MTTAPTRQLTVEEFFHTHLARETERWELVAGVPVMTPSESGGNLDVAYRLARHLDDATEGWLPRLQFSVLLRDEHPPTMRQPDLTLVRAGTDPSRWYARPDEVALVVEVVSPSSARVDHHDKRREYAAAGIPAYLIVDVRGKTATLTLYDVLVVDPDRPDAPPSYADATGDGSFVTLHLGDQAVSLTTAEIVAAP